jgi:prevent-host-death family protein
MHWQVQQAKQRLSEVLRAAETDGVQYVTKHGRDIAVVMSIEEYRRLTGEPKDLIRLLVDGPDVVLTDEEVDAMSDRRPEPYARETAFGDS